jgi:hypothetical protein
MSPVTLPVTLETKLTIPPPPVDELMLFKIVSVASALPLVALPAVVFFITEALPV